MHPQQSLQPKSTTSTPSGVSTDDVSLSAFHSLIAQYPQDKYRVGNLMLNITLAHCAICDADDENVGNDQTCNIFDQTTCRAIPLNPDQVSIKGIVMSYAHKAVCLLFKFGLNCISIPVIHIPLSVSDKLSHILPPFIFKYLWKSVVVPSLIGVA